MIIFLNGKPRSGKDTVADILIEKYDASRLKMTEPIDAAFQALFDLEDYEFTRLRENFKDDLGHLPSSDGYDSSLREFYIKFSEEFLKPLLGPDVFGRLAGHRMRYLLGIGTNVVISDCGFNEEVQAIINGVPEGTQFYGIRVERDGTEWDSREPVDFERLGIEAIEINNNGTLYWLEKVVTTVAEDMLGLRPSIDYANCLLQEVDLGDE
mgnify:CR=1 FL=1